MRFLSLLLLGLCICVVCEAMWYVCEVVSVPYLDAMVVVTMMRLLLFVLHVSVVRECDDARVTAILAWGTGEVCLW